MIALKLSSGWLDINAKTTVTVNLLNPIFDQDSVYRVTTRPFKIDATPNNVKKLGHINRHDVRTKTVKVVAELHIHDQLFESGFLIINGFDDQISVSFQSVEIDFLSELEQIKIDEILETITIPQTVQPETVWQLDAPPDRYTLIINDQAFSLLANSGEDYDDIIDWFIAEVNAIYPGAVSFNAPGSGEFTVNGSAYDPFVIDFTFYEGMSLVSSTNIGEARQTNFQSYLSDLITTPVDSHGFPTIRNLTAYGTSNNLYTLYLNYYHDGNFIDNTEELTKDWYMTYIPFVKVVYILDKIIENTSLSDVAGGWLDIGDIAQLVIYNNRTLDQLFYELYPSDVNNQYFNGGKSSFSLNDHVPEMTAKEFLDVLVDGFALFHRVVNNVLYIDKKVTPLSLPPIDWTTKQEPEVNEDILEDEGFYIEFTKDEKDTYQVDMQHDPLTVGDGVNRLPIPWSVPYNVTLADTHHDDLNQWKMIVISQILSNTEGLGENEYGLRFFFDRGIQEDADGADYWMADYSDTDTQGNSIGDLSLTISGEKGLYKVFYEKYVELLDNNTVEKVMRLSIQDILNLKKWDNARRYMYSNDGAFVGVIKSVQFKATTKGISLSRVVFIKE